MTVTFYLMSHNHSSVLALAFTLSELKESNDSFEPLGEGKSIVFEDVKELFLLNSFTITLPKGLFLESSILSPDSTLI